MWKCPLEIKGETAMGQDINDVSAQRKGVGMGNVSEGILSSFLKSKKRREKYFRSYKIWLMKPYNKD